MLKIYTSPSCASCRKAVAFLKEQKIAYTEKNIMTSVLNEEELKDILAKSENGTDDIISKRSKVFKEKNLDVDNMTIKELIGFIRENPTILKRPIIVNDRLIQVGYNSEEIRTFIPRELRSIISIPCEECQEAGGCDCMKEERKL